MKHDPKWVAFEETDPSRYIAYNNFKPIYITDDRYNGVCMCVEDDFSLEDCPNCLGHGIMPIPPLDLGME